MKMAGELDMYAKSPDSANPPPIAYTRNCGTPSTAQYPRRISPSLRECDLSGAFDSGRITKTAIRSDIANAKRTKKIMRHPKTADITPPIVGATIGEVPITSVKIE
ncbi:hypothetical protein GCM10022289_10670 [Pedobacter jeongneungensis]|uniref:Uncharacterized protein n=1 Tax=Pedobacter jeongneungensis TaxID=947309 RepID=A0ABP8B749_9SPHI